MQGDIRNAAGERLDYSFHEGAGFDRALVVIGHGVTANKDREWAIVLGDTLAAAGIDALRFSFSGNGDSEGRFLDSCPSKEAADLSAVLKFAREQGAQRLVFVGHSMGAAVGVLGAVGQPGTPRLTALVSLAGMVHTRDFASRKFGDQEVGASLMWDKPECPLGLVFMDDMFAVDSVVPLATGIRIPWFLVHGTGDTVVPIEESREIAAGAGDAQLVEIEGADHVFSGAAATEMARLTRDWILARLS